MADETARRLFQPPPDTAHGSSPLLQSPALRMTPSRSLRMSSLLAGGTPPSAPLHHAHASPTPFTTPSRLPVRLVQPAQDAVPVVPASLPNCDSNPTHSSEDSFFADIDLENVDLRMLRAPNFLVADPSTDNSQQQTNPDYYTMNAKQLRELCSTKGVHFVGKDNKANRIKALEMYDRKFGKDGSGAEPKRTKHCIFRVVNLVTSTKHSAKFATTGDTLSREQLDTGATAYRMRFWNEIALDYKKDEEEYRHLKHNHRLFSSSTINPGVIREHSGEKLCDMWKDLNKKYNIALANSKRSGNHNADFENYVSGNAGVLYLWMCLQDKPNLMSFVQGGLLEEDEYDSLRAELHPQRSISSTPTPKQGKKRAAQRSTPPTRKSPRTERQDKQKQDDDFVDKVHDMIRSVSAFLSHGRPDEQASKASSTSYSELDELRDRIIGLHAQIQSAPPSLRVHLENDLAFYIRRRDRLRRKLEEEEEDQESDD